MRTTAEETERNNKKILDAAIKVFADKGYVLAEMDEIAAEAGISKGPLYYRYKSKRELFIAALQEEIGRELAEYAAIWSQDKYIIDILHDDFETYIKNIRFGMHLPDTELFPMPNEPTDRASEVVSLAREKLHGYIEIALTRAVNSGELRRDTDVRALTDLIFVFSYGLYQCGFRNRRNEPALERAETVIKDFVDMVEIRYCRPK